MTLYAKAQRGMARTLFDKIWEAHRVLETGSGRALLYVDRVFLHERTGALALRGLAERGRVVARPEHVFATMDHIVDTQPGRGDASPVPGGSDFVRAMRDSARDAGIRLFDIADPDQGISHLIAAEQGIALPGLVVVCPDSHTCTLGALGALGIGIGSSDCEHAMATQMLNFRRPLQTRIRIDGRMPASVSGKDVILALIARFGAGGGAGHALEFAGEAISALPMSGRFTLCNMAVEFAGFTGLIGVDETTLEYVRGRPFAPAEDARAVEQWRDMRSDPGASFDRELSLDANEIGPMVTWGTSPEQAVPVTRRIEVHSGDPAAELALAYMGLSDGQSMSGVPIDGAFIGSCTNSRLDDLRAAADELRGRRVAPGVRALCVPASSNVRRAAEREGLHQVFLDAGFEWREAGCSLCFYAGGEGFAPGQRVISTTNRNFEGRQGPGVRTHLASPRTVAASAVAGVVAAPEAAA